MGGDVIKVETLVGKDVVAISRDLDRLLNVSLSGWPFFMRQPPNSEKGLRGFLKSVSDTLHAVIIRDGSDIVGGTFGHAAGWNCGTSSHKLATICDPNRVYWISLTALMPEYQGRGLSHQIYNARDPWIIASGLYDHIAHMLVVRPDDHPMRPAGHVPYDTMWAKRGYRHLAGLDYQASYLDSLDEPGKPTQKNIQLWIKDLK